VVAVLTGEPAAPVVEPLLRDTVDRPRISAVNLAEVVDVLVRLQAWPVDGVIEKIDWLQAGGLEVIAADPEIGLQAGKLHARLYDRTRSPLSLADCVALATAQALGQSLATSDRALAAAARGEGVGLIALPDSRGARP
jgi:predicted nucleic acid-binding protein